MGRESEMKTLLESFDRFCDGKKNSVFVAGSPGIGKSALINDVQKPIIEKRGFFIAGKFDQLRKDTPYSAIIQAFKFLIKSILTERSDKVQIFKYKIESV